jgi:putative addiction module component (TIGR02574 family)
VSRTYDGVLSGDHLEWKGTSPKAPMPVEVKVEVPDAIDERTPEEGRGAADWDFSGLTPAERLDLADRLWNSVDADQIDWTLTPGQQAELERRLVEYDRNPDAGETWESIREEIIAERSARRASAA